MSIFICDECGQTIDADFDGCLEHPENPDLCCCQECAEELEEKHLSEKQAKMIAYGLKEKDFL